MRTWREAKASEHPRSYNSRGRAGVVKHIYNVDLTGWTQMLKPFPALERSDPLA